MDRGVRLACEACGYWADVFEQTRPVEAVSPIGVTGSPEHAGASWTSYLCPQCVVPLELPQAAAAVCPQCASPLLDYAAAAEALAMAARTRAAFDLQSERVGREQVVHLIAYAGSLKHLGGAGRLPEPEARAALLDLLRRQMSDGAAAASVWLPLANTSALDGLERALAAAPTVAECATLLQARLEEADRAIGALEHLMDEEADLPGVPCPQCATGHLLHWPIWV